MESYLFSRPITGAEADKGHITIPKLDAQEFKKRLGNIKIENEAKQAGTEDENGGYYLFKSRNRDKSYLLKIVYRSPTGQQRRSELRLYLRKELGWRAERGDTLCVYFGESGDRTIWLDPFGGKEKEEKLKRILRAKNRLQDHLEEKINDSYYGDGEITVKATTKIKRSARLVQECLYRSGYKCEAGFDEPKFISKKTKKTYLEAHHMVPNNKKYKNLLKTRLDRPENLYALSPHAHRAIHCATFNEKEKIINALLQKRDDVLDVFNLTKEELLKIYDT